MTSYWNTVQSRVEKVFCNRTVAVSVRMLRNMIGWPELLVAAGFTRTATLLLTGCQPMLLVLASVVIGQFIACRASAPVHWVTGAVLSPLIQPTFTCFHLESNSHLLCVHPSVHPTNFFSCPSSHPSNSQVFYHPTVTDIFSTLYLIHALFPKPSPTDIHRLFIQHTLFTHHSTVSIRPSVFWVSSFTWIYPSTHSTFSTLISATIDASIDQECFIHSSIHPPIFTHPDKM